MSSQRPAGRLEIETKPKVPAYKSEPRTIASGEINTICPFAMNFVPAALFELDQTVSIMQSVWMSLHSVRSL
jgi:hypothetical protein